MVTRCIYDVSDPPGEPQVSGDLDGVVREGDLVNVTCISLGGNPPPEVAWYRGNSKLQYGATRQVIPPVRGLGLTLWMEAEILIQRSFIIHITLRFGELFESRPPSSSAPFSTFSKQSTFITNIHKYVNLETLGAGVWPAF